MAGPLDAGVIGVAREAQLSQKIGTVADACERWGMPQLTEIRQAVSAAFLIFEAGDSAIMANSTSVACGLGEAPSASKAA